MKNINLFVASVAFTCVLACTAHINAQSDKKSEGAQDSWTQLFDGKSTDGWKINENKESWSIKDGALVCKGNRSHIFYMGKEAPFKNFHFKCKVMTKPGANAGIYFHTKYQDSGWPKGGYEAQVNNSQSDPKRTGSLYAVVDVLEAPAKDNVWFTEEVIVKGRNIKIIVDGKTVVDFTEEEDRKAGKDFERKLSSGTFAFQAHDPGSEVHFKDVMVKKLAD